MYDNLKIFTLSLISASIVGCGGGSGGSPTPQPPASTDTQAPVITLNGNATMTIDVGDQFTDPGTTVTDNVDNGLQAEASGSVDTNSPGTYVITYSAEDAAGNVATTTRTVVVSAPGVDTQAPQITLLGSNPMQLTVGDSYAEPGATVTDNVDNNLVAAISGNVDSSSPGTYTITYMATDSAGNETIVTRSVMVSAPAVDSQPPVITLNGSANMYVSLDDTYNEPGASVSDNVDTDLVVSISGSVDTSTVGNYPVTYTAVDSAGNQASVTRSVFVTDPNDVPIEPQSPFTPTAQLLSREPVIDPAPDAAGFMAYGAGNVATSFNPDGYGCVEDYGFWVYSAGVTEPGIAGCTADGEAIGEPVKRHPQVTGPAAQEPVAAHRWWGSVSFLGEMQLGDPNSAGYITPDPIMARVSNAGIRVLNLPVGLRVTDAINFQYTIPDPFAEVFDGIAIANSAHSNMEAFLKESSDGAVTVEWQSGGQAVMEATFVHGSPYVYVKAFDGQPLIKTFRDDGGEKGTYHEDADSLGVWTAVAGGKQHFLVVGEGATSFSNTTTSQIGISNAANEFTLVAMPNNLGDNPDASAIAKFKQYARNVVANADIEYSVNATTQEVTVTHRYLDAQDQPIDTLAGLHPLHWKYIDNADQSDISAYNVRSARGVIKFSETDEFSYQLPYIGVLPTMPSVLGDYDMPTLQGLINDFMAQDQSEWNTFEDTYWAGKNYGKVAELAAIARSIGMESEADELIDWLKAELEDWFTADTSGQLDEKKYFVYDQEWNTLLGVDESFMSHQLLNDHHFHYGYFIRAAAEICRVDRSWCDVDQYGAMVELLIRDYAADRNDALFPYLRHFDPANGFSWASGSVNFARGNNNESTSEAANAYGAMALYGMITDQQDLVDRAIYMHASTTATYWQYWNNIDGYNNVSAEADNFPSGYNNITTSIIWGDGAVFSTWFSPLYAHILGIQGLPINPLTIHVAQYPDYMADYVSLGLSESSNQKPSGLAEDNWRDIWWNLWAMNDADAAIADYESMPVYNAEQGETKAHTYHWLHTWKNLGQPATGMPGSITASDPAAMVFAKDGTNTYVAYNFTGEMQTINFSDGTALDAVPFGFATKIGSAANGDVTAPTAPAGVAASNVIKASAELSWTAATDDTQVVGYLLHLSTTAEVVRVQAVKGTDVVLTDLQPNTTYRASVVAYDAENNQSDVASTVFTTLSADANLPPTLSGSIAVSAVTQSQATLNWPDATDDGEVSGYQVTVTDGASYTNQLVVTESVTTLSGLAPATGYQVSIVAIDDDAQQSSPLTTNVTTTAPLADIVMFTDALAAGYTFGTWPGTDSITVQNGVIDGPIATIGNFYLITPGNTPLDLSGYSGGYLKFDVKVITLGTNSDVLVKMDSGWPSLSDVKLSSYGGLPVAGGDFQSYSIPVADFIASDNSLSPGNKMDITSVPQPIVFDGLGGEGMHLQVDNIQLTVE
ncbi:hypothetical protein GCM10011369_16710 [Neiella marina]|uniref:glucan endo-1,3-beta-D-glucosidase n=1 Tax=Neiella marina TaxID=508461 RepID=A0A8J2U4S3_9GAMM|nr:immunoglobulin-like domain-containing protein [Neiella marina]GGA75505.1 hypothetical protein GCM10011369_16710 [Neiella marina]